MRSLRSKITLLVVLPAILAVLVVSFLSVFFIRNAEHTKSNQLLLLLCETGERNLDYYFTSVEKSVRKVSAFAEKELTGLEDDKLQQHSDSIRKYFDEIANKTNGVLTYYYRIDPAVSSHVKGFWYTNLTGNDFTEHEVTDITLYDTSDTSALVWFTVPKNTGNPIWLPPYITDNLDRKVVSYNVPIYWRGQFVGVIGIEIDYATVAEQVESIKLYNNGYAFLTNTAGDLICHPRIDVAKEKEKPHLPQELMSDNSFVRYTFGGVEKEAVWLKLTNGMRLYVSVPRSETEGDWQALVREVLIASAVVLILCGILTRLFARHLTRPLKQLTEAAAQADRGNYDFTLEYNGKDEVGMLTRTFMHMADHVKEHISDLNKRAFVDALTSVRNKGAFNSFMEELQSKLDENPETMEFAIGVFDCDDLKSVNDVHGHDKGDIYLKTASRLICKVFQHSPVFRIGGDEFAVILRNEDYRNRADLMDEFERKRMEICHDTENLWEQVHVSMGIAVFNPQQDHSVIDTLRRADKSMYINKHKNKGAG